MIGKLSRLFRDADTPSEDDSPRDGAFSYAGEYHAFLIGAGAGFASAAAGHPQLAAAVAAVAIGGSSAEWALKRLRGRGVVAEIRREPWYATGGIAAGYAAGIVATAGYAAGIVPL